MAAHALPYTMWDALTPRANPSPSLPCTTPLTFTVALTSHRLSTRALTPTNPTRALTPTNPDSDLDPDSNPNPNSNPNSNPNPNPGLQL